jgi:adenosylcobinamide-GDP ribazoletransferase
MPQPLRLLLIAVQFLTRLPVPRGLATSEAELGQAAAFFPLVGVIVGGGGALLHVALTALLPPSTCVLLVLIYAALITNGFHEDGLADAFDGFGGGWERERILEIMRDSRIGTFGALALILLVLAKYNLLAALEPTQVWRWLIVAHTAARWTTLPLCIWLPYAREEGRGKLVAQRVDYGAAVIATLTLLVTLLLLPWLVAALALAVVAAASAASGWYYSRRIQGITGDCLGATNQITEIALYLVAVMLTR